MASFLGHSLVCQDDGGFSDGDRVKATKQVSTPQESFTFAKQLGTTINFTPREVAGNHIQGRKTLANRPLLPRGVVSVFFRRGVASPPGGPPSAPLLTVSSASSPVPSSQIAVTAGLALCKRAGDRSNPVEVEII